MTFERNPGPPAEPAPAPGPIVAADAGGPTPVRVRLQILSTEHWSLLASGSLAWNESFARAGMYLSTLSSATRSGQQMVRPLFPTPPDVGPRP